MRFLCGATILSQTIAVTAASCLSENEGGDYAVRAGSTNRSAPAQEIAVRETIPHPQYDRGTLSYDVAILRLSQELELGAAVKPIQLPEVGSKVQGKQGTITGWGNISAISYVVLLPDILQEGRVRVVNGSRCVETGLSFGPEKLCTIGVLFVAPCLGDTGGPLDIDGKLEGIISPMAGRCAMPRVLAYTRVANANISEFIRSYL